MNLGELEKMGEHLKKMQTDLCEQVLQSDLPNTEKAAFSNLMEKAKKGDFSLSDAKSLLKDIESGKVKSLSDAC